MQYQNGIYRSALLEGVGVKKHGFGTRLCTNIIPNEAKNPVSIPTTKQIHGTDIVFLEKVDPNHIYEADAFLTGKRGIACLVRTADCLPLLLYDPVVQIVGAVHAGWRGVASHIVKSTIAKFVEAESKPQNIIAAIGPHIRQNCYEVGGELLDIFAGGGWATGGLIKFKGGSAYFSLTRAVLNELKGSGLKDSNIEIIQQCTYCNPDFHSYRRDSYDKGRQINYIYQ